MIYLGVLTNHQCDFQLREVTQQLLSPGWSTFGPRWKVARLPCPGIAKAHGQYCQQIRVIELIPCHAHPLAQPVSAGVIKWNTGLMHFSSRSLTGYQNSSSRVDLDDRAGATR